MFLFYLKYKQTSKLFYKSMLAHKSVQQKKDFDYINESRFNKEKDRAGLQQALSE